MRSVNRFCRPRASLVGLDHGSETSDQFCRPRGDHYPRPLTHSGSKSSAAAAVAAVEVHFWVLIAPERHVLYRYTHAYNSALV
jgi:hypothetical protein